MCQIINKVIIFTAVTDKNHLSGGKTDFEAVMERYMSGSKKVSLLVVDRPAVYIVWDILWYEKCNIINLALTERKKLLDNALENRSYFVAKYILLSGEALVLAEVVKALNSCSTYNLQRN